MIERARSLRLIGMGLVVISFLAGAMAIWLWVTSNHAWQQHRERAFVAGVTTYYALQNATSPSAGVQVSPLSAADQAHAKNGAFRQITHASPTGRITIVPISADEENQRTGAALTLAVSSPELTYRLANLPHREGQTAAETTGEVFRLLASYCSDPVMVGQMGDARWIRIEGGAVWNCDTAPSDRRLLAGLLAIITLGIALTIAMNLSNDFTQFAELLKNRRRLGGPTSYAIKGPQELQDIVQSVNSYLETERSQLESRAAVLTGVSHDLGTPATRLRLRAALIPDIELRAKLEADIDSMTGMIESVLTYTRSEMSAETPRKLSLNALIDAIVADYQDMGRNVNFRGPQDVVLQVGGSVFSSRQGKGVMIEDRQITVVGQPIALQRALTNLIENALKYGRRATIALETDANCATIVVEDEGSDNSATEIEALMAPFQRGDNTATIDGYGLGLTIVATIAHLHGGSLTFEDTSIGVAAKLMIQRS